MSKVFRPEDVELVYVYESGEKDTLTVDDQVRSTQLFDPESGADLDVVSVIAGGEEFAPESVSVRWETPSGDFEVVQGVFGYDIELEAPNGELYYPVEVFVE